MFALFISIQTICRYTSDESFVKLKQFSSPLCVDWFFLHTHYTYVFKYTEKNLQLFSISPSLEEIFSMQVIRAEIGVQRMGCLLFRGRFRRIPPPNEKKWGKWYFSPKKRSLIWKIWEIPPLSKSEILEKFQMGDEKKNLEFQNF